MSKKGFTSLDARWMSKALHLAERGISHVEPNPAVGAIIVKNQKIIAKGYHHYFGAAHAEVDALANAKKKGISVWGATLYVTLEPCCHWGKTSPCTDAVIESGLRKVVVAELDPSPTVGGKGISILKKAGLDVQVGLLAEDARRLNSWFYRVHQTGQPWVLGKWAQTLDGKLAARTGRSQWISCEESRQEAHRLRRGCQAIIVGVETVLSDDPKLSVRLSSQADAYWTPPHRVVLDSHLRIPLTSTLVQTAKDVPTWVLTLGKNQSAINKLKRLGVNVNIMPPNKKGKINLKRVITFCAAQCWQRVMVEGGAAVLSSFLADRLIDELAIFQAPILAMDAQAIQLNGLTCSSPDEFLRDFVFHRVSRMGSDIMLRLLKNTANC